MIPGWAILLRLLFVAGWTVGLFVIFTELPFGQARGLGSFLVTGVWAGGFLWQFIELIKDGRVRRFVAVVFGLTMACALYLAIIFREYAFLAGVAMFGGLVFSLYRGFEKRGWKTAAGLGSGIVLVTLGLYGRYLDYPAFEDPMPDTLVRPEIEVKACYLYFLSPKGKGKLCRFDGAFEGMQAMIDHLGLRPVEEVPEDFWEQNPHYWPKGPGSEMLLFESSPSYLMRTVLPPNFAMAYDPNQERAFLLVRRGFGEITR